MPHDLNPTEIYQRLLAVANEDGIITSDEQVLLDAVRENLEKYFEILDIHYRDGVITSEEQHDFYLTRKKIMNDAIEIAKQDDKVTKDEYRLLKAVQQLLHRLEGGEHY